jgi:L-arabinose isomerase
MEIKNAQAMKILDASGTGGALSEYYALAFREDEGGVRAGPRRQDR